MYYKTFQGLELPALGMGALRFPATEGEPDRIDREKARTVIRAAMEHGINYFDTSHIYQNGDSERMLGEALSEYPRDRYFLASKFYVKYAANIQEVFAQQLERCQTDYFDFYLLHGVDENCVDAYMDPGRGYLEFLLEQKRAGKIRHTGFSSHASPDGLKQFLDWYDGFDMALIQINYLDWTLLSAKRQYELLTERGIPVWVMEPLKGGRLSALSPEAAQILTRAAPERSVSSWAFRYLMSLENVQMILSGMSSVEQVENNASTFADGPDPLRPEEKVALEKAAGIFRQSLGVPCSACRYCCSACPAGLDIPLLIKGYNEYRVSGETWRIAELNHTKNPKECLQCGACLKHCPQKIRIPDVMSAFAEVLK